MRDVAARVIAAAAMGRRGAAAFAYWDAAADARFAADFRVGAAVALRERSEYISAPLAARVLLGRICRRSEDAADVIFGIGSLAIRAFPLASNGSYRDANVAVAEVIAVVQSENVWRPELRRAVSLAPRRNWSSERPIRRRVQYLAAALVGYRAAAGGPLASAAVSALEAIGRLTDHPVAGARAAQIRRDLGSALSSR